MTNNEEVIRNHLNGMIKTITNRKDKQQLKFILNAFNGVIRINRVKGRNDIRRLLKLEREFIISSNPKRNQLIKEANEASDYIDTLKIEIERVETRLKEIEKLTSDSSLAEARDTSSEDSVEVGEE